MRYRMQFRMGVQAIALSVFLLNLPSLALAIINNVRFYAFYSNQMSILDQIYYSLFGVILALLPIGVTVYLFFRPMVIVNMVIPLKRHYCANCAMMLPDPLESNCPECGTALPNDLLGVVNQSDTSTVEDD
jgi:hypothetical protein